MNKAVFLDRDGVINYSNKYHNTTKEDITICEDVAQLSRLNRLGFKLFIVTNQSWVCNVENIGTGKPYLKVQQNGNQLIHLMDYILDELRNRGVTITAWIASTDKRAMHKPSPAMIYTLSVKYNINLIRSFFVGDSEQDRGAALSAGCTFLHLDRTLIMDVCDSSNNMQSIVNDIIHIDNSDNDINLQDETIYNIEEFIFKEITQ